MQKWTTLFSYKVYNNSSYIIKYTCPVVEQTIVDAMFGISWQIRAH